MNRKLQNLWNKVLEISHQFISDKDIVKIQSSAEIEIKIQFTKI
jgi:hypothetical protein